MPLATLRLENLCSNIPLWNEKMISGNGCIVEEYILIIIQYFSLKTHVVGWLLTHKEDLPHSSAESF